MTNGGTVLYLKIGDYPDLGCSAASGSELGLEGVCRVEDGHPVLYDAGLGIMPEPI